MKNRIPPNTVAALLAWLPFAVILMLGAASTDPATAVPTVSEQPSDRNIFDEHCCTCDECAVPRCDMVELVDRPEFEISREQMVREVVMLWNMFFDDSHASADDSRRQAFDSLAEHLVNAVMLYQDKRTDLGGIMPGHKNDHLIVAFMVARESSVIADVQNTRPNSKGEVCLLQLHGAALAGHTKKEVRSNPELCLMLGVRWIASQIPHCQQVPNMIDEWTDDDWVGPLSLYAGGPNALRKDGRCREFSQIRSRVQAVKMYRMRIDVEMERHED